MKHLKSLFIFAGILLFSLNIARSQNYAGVTSVGTVNACPGTILVPVYLTGHPNIMGFSLTIYYDAAVLSAIQIGNIAGFVTNVNSTIGTATAMICAQTDYSTSEKQVKIGWSSLLPMILDTAGGGVAKICDLKFHYFGGSANLYFDNSKQGGQNCEYIDTNSVVMLDTSYQMSYYIDGAVNVGTPPAAPGIITGSVTPCYGNNPYSVAAVNDVDYVWFNTCNFSETSATNAIIYNLTSSSIIPGDISVYGTNTCGIGDTSVLSLNSILDSSSAASSVSASVNPICPGSSSVLTINGGFLGAGAGWHWYSGTCGGTSEGSGPGLTITPSNATSYFVRAEGTCNTTACAAITINLDNISLAAGSIYSNSFTICSGSSISLNVTGGSLGTGADWHWYSNSCGGTALGVGNSIAFTPASSGTYYVRAEGTCNTTVCDTAIVTVDVLSTDPLSASAMPASICPASTTSLSASGGTLGTGADWVWYENSCGGTNVGNGAGLNVNPVVTTVYFVRAEGNCNTTACVSTEVSIFTLSTVASSALASPSTICPSTSTTLTLTGGNLGASAGWYWYSNSCGGAFEGNGLSLIATPASSTVYFVRAEGSCNTTTCLSTTVIVNVASSAASAINASLLTICQGATTSLSLSGGSLGAGANWVWYSNSCGGTVSGSGSTLNVNPTTSTNYFVQAVGTCNTTSCASVTITVNNTSVLTTIAANPAFVCTGLSSSLTVTAGTLGTSGTWHWFRIACGNTNVGYGSTVTVTPSVSTTYWVRGEGLCNTTTCKSVRVTITSTSTAATAAIANPATICSGASSTLGFAGGSLGLGAVWQWYSSSCGGLTEGNGTSLAVSPTFTTIYYVRAEGSCNTTTCVSTMVNVNMASVAATSGNASPSTICSGASSTLGFTGGSLGLSAYWTWFSGSCAGTPAGNGSTIIVNPTLTTTYFVRAQGLCNTTSCVSEEVVVNYSSTQASSAIANPNTICSGSGTTLGITGGNLGTGAAWYWYSGSCGGSAEGNGTSIVVSPTTSTTYFVRAEGICNTTSCQNALVNVNDLSVIADSVTVSSAVICFGANTTLAVAGGTLGTGADWVWYSGSCGGTTEGNGNTVILGPASSTLYFVRAEGLCNTTNCITSAITVDIYSTSPTAVSTPDSICNGQSSTISVSTGTLGTGASWMWYSGSCGGTAEGNGLSLQVSPVVTTLYFVRAEGNCNTTSCFGVIVTVKDLSVAPSSLSASLNPVCSGLSSTLGITGGSLGFQANWFWFSGSCGGTAEGNGPSLNLAPVVTTTYFVRAEGNCNTTSCLSLEITVNETSVAATSANANPNVICQSMSSTLSINGGTLGTSADWKWYTGSCGGTYEGIGSSITVTPTVTTTFYVLAEGTCNTTPCVNVAVTVDIPSIDPTGATATSVICAGSSSTLSVTGGLLGTGAQWGWYSTSCGVGLVGTGNNLVVSPASTTTYFVRAEGTCNTTTCVSTEITVNTYSTAATGITSAMDTVCPGVQVSLGFTGGSLGTSGDWNWYSSSCGGTSQGIGLTINVNPSVATTYYLRAEGTCNTTLCVSKTITLKDTSVLPAIINGLDSICPGSSATLVVSGGTLGTGAEFYWYTGSCGGILAGSGGSLIFTPSVTTDYYVRAEGECNTTTCVNKLLHVVPFPIPAASSNSPVCYGDTLKLFCNAGVSYSWSGPDGFTSSLKNPVKPNFTVAGKYYVTVTGPFGCTGTDSLDATLQPFSGLSGILKYSGGDIAAANATIEIFLKVDTIFKFFDSTQYTGGYMFNNLLPGEYLLKATLHGNQYPKILPTYYDSAHTWETADTILIPCNSQIVKDVKMVEIPPVPTGGTGAISGNIYYSDPNTKAAGEPVPGAEIILSQEPDDDPVAFTTTDTGGYYGFDSLVYATYKLYIDIPGFPLITTYSITIAPLNLTYQHRNFIVDTVTHTIHRQSGVGIDPNFASEFSVNVYPNPFKDLVNINYTLKKKSRVDIEIIDITGKVIEKLVDADQTEGDHTCKFNAQAEGSASKVYIIKFAVNNTVYLKKIISTK